MSDIRERHPYAYIGTLKHGERHGLCLSCSSELWQGVIQGVNTNESVHRAGGE
jgi:hypothetical protein